MKTMSSILESKHFKRPWQCNAACTYQMQGAITALITYILPVAAIVFGLSSECVGAPLFSPDAKFATLNPITYELKDKTNFPVPFITSAARIFYNLHPAEIDARFSGLKAEQIPVFFFVNGGPGCPTCNGLLSYNTGPKRFDDNDSEHAIKENKYRWSRMGHLLYVDPPNTGYSYNLALNPGSLKQRRREFNFRNFNPYIDAAQMVRVLLSVIDDPVYHLSKNPVVLVGESYGGTRTTIMLDMLLHPEKYQDGGSSVYHDQNLVNLINEHHRNVIGDLLPLAENYAKQFGKQILIEPQLTGAFQTKITGEMYEEKESDFRKLVRSDQWPFYGTCEDVKTENCDKYANAITFALLTLDVYQSDLWPLASTFYGLLVVDKALSYVGSASELLNFDLRLIKEFRSQDRIYEYEGKLLKPYRVFDDSSENGLGKIIRAPWFKDQPAFYRAHVLHMLDIQKQKASIKRAARILGPGMNAGGLLRDEFGVPETWDSYLLDCGPGFISKVLEKEIGLKVNLEIYQTFYNKDYANQFDMTPESTRFGQIFLENLPLVRVMLTNAARDFIIYPPAIPVSFKEYTEIISEVEVTKVKPTLSCSTLAPKCDANIAVTYKNETPKQLIWFPYYEKGGHAVSWKDGEKLFKDVKAWMSMN